MPLEQGQRRLKILFVTSHWPLAPAYGAQQRVLNIARLLSRFGEISFVIAPGEPEDEETIRRTKEEFRVLRVMRPLPLEPDGFISRFVHRIRHEFDSTYMATDGYMVSQADRNGLQELIDQHDLIWVHTVRIANWFRIYQWPHSVLDVDDLNSRLYQSRAQATDSTLKRLINCRMSRIWSRRERLSLSRFRVLTVCSEDDRRYLGLNTRIHVIPNGSNRSAVARYASSEQPRIGFIGNCTFTPNEEGVKWFIRDVWPLIKKELPIAQLRLVGRESQGYLTKLGPDIVGLGWLEDPGEEIASWLAMIVPIKEGSGTRVKVAEGFARMCPIIATTIGAFGYDGDSGRDLLLADSASDFASACILLLKNPQLGEALAQKAYQRFLERWQWESFEGTVGKVVEQCLTDRHREHSSGVTQDVALAAVRGE